MTVEALTQLNSILATGGFLALGVTAILVIDLWQKRSLAEYIRSWGLCVAFLITVLATALTLVYSEIFGITPCGFCWFERMMLYPQLILIAAALYFRDTVSAARYGIMLSGVGFLISIYHHYIQMGGAQFIACPTAGADCAKRFMFEYGFMTFPLLSALLFAFLIVLYLYVLKTSSSPKVG
jgi:disulfide bond formation protein DsbB